MKRNALSLLRSSATFFLMLAVGFSFFSICSELLSNTSAANFISLSAGQNLQPINQNNQVDKLGFSESHTEKNLGWFFEMEEENEEEEVSDFQNNICRNRHRFIPHYFTFDYQSTTKHPQRKLYQLYHCWKNWLLS